MFLEPHRSLRHRKGWIEVICGSMFSGKSEELIRRLKRARIAQQKVKIFKPALDVRYSVNDIVSHDANTIPCTPVEQCASIQLMADGVDVVGIDEAQFFDDSLSEVVESLALRGIRVIVAGLDMDFQGKPFGAIPALLARAEYITKLHAICMKCGDIANYSYRKTASEAVIMLGEKEEYEARCRYCFFEDRT